MVARASVVITNVGTANEQTALTDGNGVFVVSALPYGKYIVQVTATGFSSTKSEEITLNVGATVNVSLSLSVAAGTESVVKPGESATGYAAPDASARRNSMSSRWSSVRCRRRSRASLTTNA